MKKIFALFSILALLLPVLAGCQSANPPAQNNGATTVPTETSPANILPPETTPAITPLETTVVTEPATKISREEALAIALKDADLTEDQITDLDVELDRDDGKLHYDVDFEKDGKDYDYEIDAVTGDILRKEVPKAPAASTSSNTNPATDKKQLTKTEARDIALKHAGLSVSQVQDLEVELDRDDGTTHYDVEFEADGYEYDYEIHAETGKILKSQKQRD